MSKITMTELILVAIKAPGEEPSIARIMNGLETFQSIVGGYIEAIKLTGTLTLICNEDGLSRQLAPNLQLYVGPVVGTVVVTKANSAGNFVSLSAKDQTTALDILRDGAL